MAVINTILGVPLGYIMYLAYQLTGHFGASVLIFALIVRIILLPVNIITHKNSIRLLNLQPQLNKIKRKFAGDKERLSEAQYELFKEEKYNPFPGLVPLIIQLLILLGVLQVMYHPLQHVLRYSPDTIAMYTQSAHDYVSQALPGTALPEGAGLQLYVAGILGLIDLSLFGINLGTIPSLLQPTIELLVPVLSGVSALAYCLVQNALSPGALSQSKKTNAMLTLFTVAFSIYFAAVTPSGVGVYWTAANILSICIIFLLELIYSPKKHAAQALAQIRQSQKTPQQQREEKQLKQQLKLREKQDTAKFITAKKKLVFYALSGGQYKYYKTTIDYLIDNSDVIIHYLTNDPDDAVFDTFKNSDCLIPYYASQQKTISLLLKLDAGIMVTTVQDLQIYHMKRSVARTDIEYIHIPHGPASLHLTARENAYDHFDTFFCVGPHQADELRRREEMAGLKRKNLVKTGYGLYDLLAEQYKQEMLMQPLSSSGSGRPQILIAPSWQDDCILDICIEPMLESLAGNDWTIIIRPHPQYVQIYPERMEELQDKYARAVASGGLVFDMDFSNNKSTFMSDLLITDWSGIAFEFSYCTLKPCIFINTPMKIMNPNYEKYNLEVTDITLRDKVGVSLNPEDAERVRETAERLLGSSVSYQEQIKQVIADYVYYPGRSGEAGGKYILGRLKKDTRPPA